MSEGLMLWTNLSTVDLIHSANLKFQKSSLIQLMALFDSGGQSTQIKYLSKSTDTYNKILPQ